MGAKEKIIKELAEEGEEILPSKAAGAFGRNRKSIESIKRDTLDRIDDALAAANSEKERIALKKKQKEIELAYREMANLPKEEQETIVKALAKKYEGGLLTSMGGEEAPVSSLSRLQDKVAIPEGTGAYSRFGAQESFGTKMPAAEISTKPVTEVVAKDGKKSLGILGTGAPILGIGAGVLGAGAGAAAMLNSAKAEESTPKTTTGTTKEEEMLYRSLLTKQQRGVQLSQEEQQQLDSIAYKKSPMRAIERAQAAGTAVIKGTQAAISQDRAERNRLAALRQERMSPGFAEKQTAAGEAFKGLGIPLPESPVKSMGDEATAPLRPKEPSLEDKLKVLDGFVEELKGLSPDDPEYATKKSDILSRFKQSGMNPADLQNRIKELTGPTKEDKQVTPPGETPAKPAGEKDKIPNGPTELAQLFEDARKNYAALYGKHGEALASEAEALKGDMERARQLYQESVAKAESRYEKEKAMAQWGQIAETIGRSLISLVAARNSLKKGRDFTQGLDPRAQVDWMGQLQEARSTLGRDLDQANKLLSLDREQAETGYKGRVGEQQAIFEGKRESARALMDELRAMRSEQAAEGRQAKRDEKSLRAELDREQRAADARQEQLINATTADRLKSVQEVYNRVGKLIPNLYSGKSSDVKEAEAQISAELSAQGVPPAKVQETLDKAKSKGILWWKKYGPESQQLIMTELGMALPRRTRPEVRAEVEQEITGKGAPVEVRTKEDYDKLPSGTKFTWVYPDGRTKTGTK